MKLNVYAKEGRRREEAKDVCCVPMKMWEYVCVCVLLLYYTHHTEKHATISPEKTLLNVSGVINSSIKTKYMSF